jgi:hypothetical protein
MEDRARYFPSWRPLRAAPRYVRSRYGWQPCLAVPGKFRFRSFLQRHPSAVTELILILLLNIAPLDFFTRQSVFGGVLYVLPLKGSSHFVHKYFLLLVVEVVRYSYLGRRRPAGSNLHLLQRKKVLDTYSPTLGGTKPKT